jgi:hypothetical protein
VLLQQAMCVVRSEESLQATCVSSGSLPRITPPTTSVTELLYFITMSICIGYVCIHVCYLSRYPEGV